MGFFGSSEEETDTKIVDSNGQVNNNIVIQEAKDVHKQMLSSEYLVIASYFLCFAEIVKIVIYIYTSHQRRMKRKYNQKPKTNA